MRTLLFDIDGTLLITQGAGGDALTAVMESEFGLKDANIDLHYCGRTDRSLINQLLAQNGLPTDELHFLRLRDAYFAMFPKVLKRNGGTLLPGVVPILQRCQQDLRVRSCVMTGNCEFTAREKLKHFSLLDHFTDIFSGDHDAHRDDMARRAKRDLLDRYGQSNVHSLVVIGDTPADVQCGKAIGAETVAVCTGEFDREQLSQCSPDWIVDDLSDPELDNILLGS
jgi:phosphoglycolate phosphatase